MYIQHTLDVVSGFDAVFSLIVGLVLFQAIRYVKNTIF